MFDDSRVSEALYAGLCSHIGTATEVTMRREVMDTHELIKKPVETYFGIRSMMSGSYREGFRFESSDIDAMYWYTNHKVITDVSQFSVHDLPKHSIIFLEDSNTSPGFVYLKLLSQPRDKNITSSIVSFNGGTYISSSKWRQMALEKHRGDRLRNNLNIHGPCVSSSMQSVEFDFALCFHSSYWPRLMDSWKRRCSLIKWPPHQVCEEILRNGCHVVPVGSKSAVGENELEWRLSFSQAEQKLVCSMNHTQFLCYGLLKIFLREVINLNIEEPFLCSYFIKTTLFWLIQIGNVTWSPNKLLDCFWKSFKCLNVFVLREGLPNFFYLENNMFASKLSTMNGARARESLMENLNALYEKGILCLLQSPTVRAIIEPVLSGSFYRLDTGMVHMKTIADMDVCLKREIQKLSFPSAEIKTSYLYLQSMLDLSQSPHTELQTLILQSCLAKFLFKAVFIWLDSLSDRSNRKEYKSHKLICNLLKLSGRIGDVSSSLHLAIYYYRTGRYRETLRVSALTKLLISQPHVMYKCKVADRKGYNESVVSWSLSKRMMKGWVEDVCLYNNVHFIQELDIEQKVSYDSGTPILYISPFVLANILCMLSNYKLGNMSQCLESLTNVQTLLLYDGGKYVPLHIRDLSWQILGISQHVVGDLKGALESYLRSLRQDPFHKIQNATKYRIAIALNQLSAAALE